jgi:hypothetical protein
MANENSVSTGWLLLYVLVTIGLAYWALTFVGGI